MPPLLADPPPALWLILGIAALVAFGVWFRWRGKKPLLVFAAFLVAMVLLFILDKAFESPREETTRRINAMCDAATEADGTKFVEHVSSSFAVGPATRDSLKNSPAWVLVKSYKVKVTASGFSRDDFQQTSDTECIIGFMAKAEADGMPLLRYAKATFVRDPDKAWRLKAVEFFSAVNTKQAEPIPGFP